MIDPDRWGLVRSRNIAEKRQISGVTHVDVGRRGLSRKFPRRSKGRIPVPLHRRVNVITSPFIIQCVRAFVDPILLRLSNRSSADKQRSGNSGSEGQLVKETFHGVYQAVGVSLER